MYSTMIGGCFLAPRAVWLACVGRLEFCSCVPSMVSCSSFGLASVLPSVLLVRARGPALPLGVCLLRILLLFALLHVLQRDLMVRNT